MAQLTEDDVRRIANEQANKVMSAMVNRNNKKAEHNWAALFLIGYFVFLVSVVGLGFTVGWYNTMLGLVFAILIVGPAIAGYVFIKKYTNTKK